MGTRGGTQKKVRGYVRLVVLDFYGHINMKHLKRDDRD